MGNPQESSCTSGSKALTDQSWPRAAKAPAQRQTHRPTNKGKPAERHPSEKRQCGSSGAWQAQVTSNPQAVGSTKSERLPHQQMLEQPGKCSGQAGRQAARQAMPQSDGHSKRKQLDIQGSGEDSKGARGSHHQNQEPGTQNTPGAQREGWPGQQTR